MKTVPALGTSVSRAARGAQALSLFIPATVPDVMEKNARPISLQLARGQVHRLDPADGVREIQVLDGVVWLTTTPAEGDILLRASDRFSTPNAGRIVFEALKDASVLLVPAPRRAI
ncbi:hypothetical protein CfE428DRAFT_1704 [Chthoniobacter flavus Ellin428]|uniref:DUF2917 domain-containing protein n=1 Tax=Chthoniobacter flavus Ellin428 TaxID=497964 RepID=B4CYG6_9BACT|nr:DUF2917 domain-containing protein [Chthoniobacter flavus]EDY20507.1 hypothetical protein CfE428DRAFT_1704 [Chthoniobacter flavus Ellin428]TCO85553.1 DUF2917 family protein [Chthoniobacter flavus]